LSYDALNQLIVEDAPIAGRVTWSYDPGRNRATQVSPTGTVTYSYDATDALIKTEAGAVVTTISYDENGCRIKEQQGAQLTTYTWDPSDRLLTLRLPSGAILTNSYRADGLRHRKLEGSATQQMVWDGRDVLAWVDGAGALGQFYSRGSVLARAHRGGEAKRLYHADALGTVQALTDQAQLLETSYRLTAWGRVLSGSAAENAWLYVGEAGYWYESMADRYYVRARWLTAGEPQWLSFDPLLATANRSPSRSESSLFTGGQRRWGAYPYAHNRPTVDTDPSGLVGEPTGPPFGLLAGRLVFGLAILRRVSVLVDELENRSYPSKCDPDRLRKIYELLSAIGDLGGVGGLTVARDSFHYWLSGRDQERNIDYAVLLRDPFFRQAHNELRNLSLRRACQQSSSNLSINARFFAENSDLHFAFHQWDHLVARMTSSPVQGSPNRVAVIAELTERYIVSCDQGRTLDRSLESPR
jgi:hypothetical protein